MNCYFMYLKITSFGYHCIHCVNFIYPLTLPNDIVVKPDLLSHSESLAKIVREFPFCEARL